MSPRTALDNPKLAEHAAEIRRLGARVVTDVVEIGRRLSEAKEIAGHGNWLLWLEREFNWSVSTAENYINVFKLSGIFPTVGNLNLDLRSLYMLAAPSTPQEVRDEIITRAESGEPITTAVVKTAIAKTKPEAEPKKPKSKYAVNPACLTMFENEDQLHAFAHAVNTDAARRFITQEQQVELAKSLVAGHVLALHIPAYITGYVRDASRAQGKIDEEETDDIYKQFPGHEIRDEVAAVKTTARSLITSLLTLERLTAQFPGHPFFGDINSTLNMITNMIRQYRRAAGEEDADQVERKLARLQELEQKTSVQADTITALRSEIKELRAKLDAAEAPPERAP